MRQPVQVPSWVFCPVCYSHGVVGIRMEGWMAVCRCTVCGCAFGVSTYMGLDDYVEEYGGGFGYERIIWDECKDRMDVVREIAIRRDPSIGALARDSSIYDWIRRYWDYAVWNEHGNQPSHTELALNGGFADMVKAVVSDPGSLVDYITDGEPGTSGLTSEEDGLLGDLLAINGLLHRSTGNQFSWRPSE